MNLVGNKAGKKKILWGQLLKISLIIIPLSTGLTSLAYFVLASRWNGQAAWLGLAGGGAIVLVILIVNLCSPVFRLPFVK
jgi:hypothetical protein